LPSNAEKVFLQLLLEGDPWRARVRSAVDPEDFEFPAYRTVYEAVLDDAPDRLDDTAARVYERLKAEGLRGLDPDTAFTQAVNWMEARHLDRELDRLEREIPLAQGDEQVRLVMEKKRLSAERNAKVPRYKITARGRGASGS
jgi:hypothetical protein